MEVVFNSSVEGASHTRIGKPCQDYSLSYSEKGVSILVLCDGHGGSCYFRSDMGAKLAAETTLDCLKGFAHTISSEKFVNKEFSITAKPKRNLLVDSEGNKIHYEELDETQKQLLQQAKKYVESSEKEKEQQLLVEELLKGIYDKWCYEVKNYTAKHPLNKEQKKIQGDNDIKKAYGCTLLAFLKTENYWLSFQIGDGCIMICDKSLNWSKPIPEDYNCFLNYTTSLSDTDALSEFRYAFSGKKDSLLAAMLCSDGLDGSLIDKTFLEDFYEQIISLSLNKDDVRKELQECLPQLSEDGNKDDISISGYVNDKEIDFKNLELIMEQKRKLRKLCSEHKSKILILKDFSEKIENLKIRQQRQDRIYKEKQVEVETLKQLVVKNEAELQSMGESLNNIQNEIESFSNLLENEKNKFKEWEFTKKNEKAVIEIELSKLTASEEGESIDKSYMNW